MSLVVVVVLGGALLLTGQRAGTAADASIERALGAAESSIRDALTSRSDRMLQVTAVLAQQTPYIGAIDRALDAGDRATLLDLGDEFQRLIGASWVLLADGDGVLVASTLQRDAFGDPLAEGALVGIAVDEGVATRGLWIEVDADGRDVLFEAVGIPMVQPGSGALVAIIVAAAAIDGALADELSQNTTSEVVFFSLDTLGVPVVAVSTIDPGPLAGPLAAFDVDSAFGTDGAGAARVAIAAGNDVWAGAVGPLASAAGFPLGGFVALRSRAAELAPFTRLRQTIVMAFAAGIVLALISSLLVARQITRPVRQLAAATRGVGDGDYDVTIPVTSRDEIGDLASAFRHMLEELREKQQLVDYLSHQAEQTVRLTAAERGVVTQGSRRDVATLAVTQAQRTGELAVGAVLNNRYEIKKILGAGGMGIVYRARDRELDETVALKTLRPDAVAADATTLARFKQEIRLARRITHRFVVRTHDLGEADGLYFITMEYVEGTNLKDLIRKSGRLPVPVTVTVGKQVCRALAVAHEQGIIHRDVKPHNIAVDPGGFIKVMDFGIARLAGRPAEGEGLTAVGTAVGTPDYMAPEQLMGEDVDARVDVYAAGAVLFECLTGRTVFGAQTLPSLIAKHLEEPPADPASINPEIPASLSQVILRALAKRREDRFATAERMLEALEGLRV